MVMAAMVPLCLLQIPEEKPQEQTLLIIQQPQQSREVRLMTERGVEAWDLEDYLTGVVMAEMPLSFPMEALKAQAVAARTYTCRKLEQSKHKEFDLCTDPSCCQGWISREQMEEKLGSGELCDKAAQAVRETAGLVLTYEDKLIDAVYFSCSGGQTEAAAAVWGTDVPYLQSVVSEGEEQASVYTSEVRVKAEEFRRVLVSENSEVMLGGDPVFWVGDVRYTPSGSVECIVLGGREFTGTALRRLFGLRSTLFRLTVTDTEFVFSVRGNGHRVGLSQYGAAAMADKGCGFEEILLHYYQGVTIQKTSRLNP